MAISNVSVDPRCGILCRGMLAGGSHEIGGGMAGTQVEGWAKTTMNFQAHLKG